MEAVFAILLLACVPVAGALFVLFPEALLLLVALACLQHRDLVLVDGRYWRSVPRKPWWRR